MRTGNESGWCFCGLEAKACFWKKATIHREKKCGKAMYLKSGTSIDHLVWRYGWWGVGWESNVTQNSCSQQPRKWWFCWKGLRRMGTVSGPVDDEWARMLLVCSRHLWRMIGKFLINYHLLCLMQMEKRNPIKPLWNKPASSCSFPVMWFSVENSNWNGTRLFRNK